MKQAILVLGANGFIGKAVAYGLASTNWAAPIRGVRRARADADEQFEQRGVDATNLESLTAALQDVSAVVNCVAGDADTILRSTKALIEAAKRNNSAPRIVHFSTMSVYGSAAGLLDETAPLLGDLGPYSAAKVAAESMCSAYPRTVILRPGCVFGPGSEQWTTRIARLLSRHRLGDLGAAGDGCCNLAPIADVVDAVLRALQNPGVDGRIYNLATPAPPTWNEFLVKFATCLHAVPVRRISRRRLRIETKLLAPPLKVAEILVRAGKLNTQMVPDLIPPSLLRLMGQEIRLDMRRAQLELGLAAQDLDRVIEEAARWFLSSRIAARA
jgi:nucleoside-diphosphate-sugar epimerase